jgi:hypothetical protein
MEKGRKGGGGTMHACLDVKGTYELGKITVTGGLGAPTLGELCFVHKSLTRAHKLEGRREGSLS